MIEFEAFKLLKRVATKYADRKGQSESICKRRISFAIQSQGNSFLGSNM